MIDGSNIEHFLCALCVSVVKSLASNHFQQFQQFMYSVARGQITYNRSHAR